MGVFNAEIFVNIGLCCFYAQQYDLALTCVEKAVALTEADSQSDVWYNIGHIALVIYVILFSSLCWRTIRNQCKYSLLFQGVGDVGMAYQCFRLAFSTNQQNAEACCNLGVLEMRKGNFDQVNN